MGYYILAGAAVVILILLVTAIVRALRCRRPEDKKSDFIADEAKAAKFAADLSELIKIETITLQEGGDWSKFKTFHKKLEELYPLTFAALDKKVFEGGALLMHLKGADSSKGAVVVMSHTDVVPAPGEWSHEPFSGDIAEGKVWGRGTVDTKGSLCAIFEAVEGLLADGVTVPRDVYIASSTDEEMSGTGASMTVEYLVNKGVKIDFVLDEGGAIVDSPLPGVSGKYAMVGVMEKGYADLKVVARSEGGHASTPPKNTPVARLGKFIARMEKRGPFRAKLTKPFRNMFAALAPYMSFGYKLLFCNMWLFGPLIRWVLPAVSSQAAALLKTTVAFTMLKGSDAPNVIPREAYVVANLRFMLHEGKDASLKKFDKIAKRYDLTLEPYGDVRDFTEPVDTESPAYQYVQRCINDVFPEIGVSPYIVLGGTDSRFYCPHCDSVLRFYPLSLSNQQMGSMHAKNENVDIASLERAVLFYRRLLENVDDLR